MGALDELIRQDMEAQGARAPGRLQQLIDDDANAQFAPPEPEPAPRGNSVPFAEPDPNMGAYDGNPLAGLLEARDQDMAANNGLGPTSRAAEALTGVNFPGARAGGSYLGNVGRNALSGGIQGGAAAYRDTGSPIDAMVGFGRGAFMGGALTGAGTAAGAAGSKVAGWSDDLSGLLDRGADESRILATGKPAPEVEAMGTMDRGALAANIEQHGLNNGWGFAGPKTYARNADALATRGEMRMRGAEDKINGLDEPPQVPIGDIITQNRNRADRTTGLADPANVGAGDFRTDLVDRLENDTITPGTGPTAVMQPAGWNGHQYAQPGRVVDLPSGQLPWERALEQRRNIDANTNFAQGGAAEPWNNATRKQVGGELRGAIDESLNTPGVPPELAQEWRTGRDHTALGLGVRDDARAALGQQPAVVLPTSPGAAVQTAAGLGTRMGGYSALAGAQRGGAGVARGVEGVVGTNSEALTGLSQQGGGGLGNAAFGGRNDSIKSWLQQKGVQVDNITEQGRGNRLGGAAQQLYQQNPGAFGQYQQQFDEAIQQGPEAVNALIGRLEEETDFRTGPMVQLQQMTGGQ